MNMFKKSCWGLSAVAVTAGVLVWGGSLFAMPPNVYPGSLRSAEPHGDSLGLSALPPSTGPSCESTGFETPEAACTWELGWICGSTFTSCSTGTGIAISCTGNNVVDENCCSVNSNPLNGWYLSESSQHCFEPHVDTANPATGEQHLRFQRDPSGGVTGTGLGGATRDSAFTPTVGPQPLTRTTVSFDLAFAVDNASGSMNYIAVADSEPNSTSVRFYWSPKGYIYVLDQGVGVYVFTDYYLTQGRYGRIEVAIDPCPADGSLGIVNYTLDGTPIYSHDFTAFPFTLERALWTHNNGGENPWDLDNASVVRGDVCVFPCGNDRADPGEDCDGTDDSCCPGRCIAPNEDGECLCATPPNTQFDCDPVVLDNGANGPFLSHGGFFSYTPDTPFTSVDTCGSDYDTEILWDLTATCDDFRIFNDECMPQDFNEYQTPGDPSAPCFNEGDFLGTSCICQPTPVGVPVTFVVDSYYFSGFPNVCTNTVVNINKKFECGVPIPGGACCDLIVGSCTQVESVDDCSGDQLVFSENKDCTLVECEALQEPCCDSGPGRGGACSLTTLADCPVGDQIAWNKGGSCNDCAETPGSCCDRGPDAGGACTEVLQAECPESAQVTWTKGQSCAEAACAETTGACCNTLEGTCTDGILSANCAGDQRVWTKGSDCAQVSCNAVLGACCDTGSENPTIASCSQTTQAECNCAKCGWTKLASCDDVDCFPNFDPIPTVSEWGMAIMTLLLLVAGKVYFGRRQSATA